MAISEENDYGESENDSYDSEDDPIFDILQESRSKLSNLSINNKTDSRWFFIPLFYYYHYRFLSMCGLFMLIYKLQHL